MDNEQAKIQESRDIIISAIAQTMVIYGVTPSVGRIYGLLYFSDKPLSLDEIKDAVAMSKGSVSTGLRELLETEMIIKVWKKGDRKDHYIAEKDFVKNFITFFVKNIRLERSITLNASSNVRPKLEDLSQYAQSSDIRREAKRDLELMSDTEAYFRWTKKIIDDMESGEFFKHYPVPGNDKGV
ncbi:GbsR/MarR family transcriptional regulator [Isachenkonia alkalipeptolytica]|uniref:HTH-type transcriptional regulator n=1 Tax=Isachenkonia alkalipeptolytica TaxID=2565777 RepID=A0AA44BDM1_9CLOT|nr:transcriptional regulator [Isachenkonia alkalipeptolytica]NBG88454.1 transcriptional regulator [Isachenkonia alkalipeptolytica]